MLFSFGIIWVVGFVASTTVIVSDGDTPRWELVNLLNQPIHNKTSFTITKGYGPPYYVPLRLLLAVSILLTLALTLIFYFVINYVEKKKG